MEKMLVGLDGSARERSVLGAAIALGKKTGAKLVLCRCIGLPEAHALPPDLEGASDPQEVPKLIEGRAKVHLEELVADVPAELRGGLRVVVGIPWQAIQQTAEQEKADLIVIGSHGFSGIDHVIGTTAAKVVNHADRSVLVVRNQL